MLSARTQFQRLVQAPDQHVPLAEAALYIALEDQGCGEPDAVLQAIEQLAAGARERGAGPGNPERAIEVLNDYLFGELGFYGNPRCYDHPDPANSFLDRVLEQRTGLPILLALVYIEVGRRLGLQLVGIGLPGHFIVGCAVGTTVVYIDPFDQGRHWSYVECAQQIALAYTSVTPDLVRQTLAPASNRAILARILRNLKHTYIARQEYAAALAAVERILLITPGEPAELRDRGVLRIRLGRIHSALEDLDRYAQLVPNAPDIVQLQEISRALAGQIGSIN